MLQWILEVESVFCKARECGILLDQQDEPRRTLDLGDAVDRWWQLFPAHAHLHAVCRANERHTTTGCQRVARHSNTPQQRTRMRTPTDEITVVLE